MQKRDGADDLIQLEFPIVHNNALLGRFLVGLSRESLQNELRRQLIVQALVDMAWGPKAPYTFPSLVATGRFSVFGVNITYVQLASFIAAVVVAAGVGILIRSPPQRTVLPTPFTMPSIPLRSANLSSIRDKASMGRTTIASYSSSTYHLFNEPR